MYQVKSGENQIWVGWNGGGEEVWSENQSCSEWPQTHFESFEIGNKNKWLQAKE